MTLAILILSEIIPKTLGAMYWQELAGFTVRTLKVIMLVLAPLVVVSQFITRLLLRGKNKSVLSRADFHAMTELGAREGVFDERESSLLRNFMRFDSVLTNSTVYGFEGSCHRLLFARRFVSSISGRQRR